MRTDWLKAGALLSAAGGFWVWTSFSPVQSLKPLKRVATDASESARRADAADSRRRTVGRGPDLVVDHIKTVTKEGRRTSSTRRFRELPAKRDPQLESDPQFQKLLEMDTARKMALLQHGDQEALRRTFAEMQGDSASISRRVLEQALADPNAEVRLAALSEISLQFDEAPLDLLGPVVEGDPNAEVRLEALEMVGEIENEEAEAVIEGALGDPDEEVRSEAADLLEDSDPLWRGLRSVPAEAANKR